MKLLDKLKNALFEEEYVEVEEKPVKAKKEKKKDINSIREEKRLKDVKLTNYDDEEEKPIAKKIAPVKEKTEVIESPKEVKKEEFKFPTVSDDEFLPTNFDVKVTEIEDDSMSEDTPIYSSEKKEVNLYQISKEDEYIKKSTANEYGNYGKTKEKKAFKPSPNISPIYGIIDDYGEQIRTQSKKEVRLTSAVRNEKIDIDDVRRKAFGTIEDDLKSSIGYEKEPIEESDDEPLLVDLRSNDAPEVNKITMGDAEEYFQDLGLEYDTDYIDASKAKASGRRLKSEEEYAQPITDTTKEEEKEELPNFLKENREEEASSIDSDTSDDDNLFDLIDSMYDK